MDTNQLKPSLWAAVERPNEIKFIKLLISSDQRRSSLLWAV